MKMTSKEVLDILVDSFQDPQDEDCDCYMLDCKQMNKIGKAIRQAQKKEKLLELYKQSNIILEKLYTVSNYYEIEIIKLKHQIKELENEK